MNFKLLLKGIIYTSFASFLWGIPQVLYFNKIKSIPALEIIAHRAIWSFAIILIITTVIGKFNEFKIIFLNLYKIIFLTITSILISINWSLFILSISLNRVQDASMGYFISPIISLGLGYIFFKEKLSFKQKMSVLLMVFAIIYLLISLKVFPFIASLIGLSWACYGLLRKKVNVSAEIGLLFETGLISFFAFLYLGHLTIIGEIFFISKGIKITLLLLFTGFVTTLPLFFFNLGVKILPLGLTGIIFFLVPIFQFLTSIIILNEVINLNKIIGFTIIWIAVVFFIIDKLKQEYSLKQKKINENNIQLLN